MKEKKAKGRGQKAEGRRQRADPYPGSLPRRAGEGVSSGPRQVQTDDRIEFAFKRALAQLDLSGEPMSSSMEWACRNTAARFILTAIASSIGPKTVQVWARKVLNELPPSLGKAAPPESDKAETLIRIVIAEVLTLLLAKNAAYGNSALDPVRLFSKANSIGQINVRIDDKLSRLLRGSNAGEDVEMDLLGYLVLKRVAEKMEQAKGAA